MLGTRVVWSGRHVSERKKQAAVYTSPASTQKLPAFTTLNVTNTPSLCGILIIIYSHEYAQSMEQMIKRNIIRYLSRWRLEVISGESFRKPILIRGARQVGKTFAVEEFARSEFKHVVSLNLEKDEDRRLFQKVEDARTLIRTLELKVKQRITPGQTLLFIDEIQNSEIALAQLRYLYEEMPHLHVIAAGSLLDVFISKNKFEIPVGRAEYCYMHPLGFDEFLAATQNELMLESLVKFELGDPTNQGQHELFNKEFMTYALIGGMPQVVAHYASGESPQGLDRIYESLIVGFRDDIGKYASSAQAQYLRHCLENAPRSVGMQIAYNHFAESDFRSREIGTAFDTLELAQLVTRVFSSRSLALPLVQNRRKAPKLTFLDVGLVNYKLGQREKFSTFSSLENIFQGQISEQIVGQTLKSFGESSEQKLSYWYRDKKGSNAEVDYILPYKDQIIPIEVKAGSSQKLQSMHTFIDERYKNGITEMPVALRVHSGPFLVTDMKTRSNNPFRLISIPYYLLFRVREILEQDRLRK